MQVLPLVGQAQAQWPRPQLPWVQEAQPTQTQPASRQPQRWQERRQMQPSCCAPQPMLCLLIKGLWKHSHLRSRTSSKGIRNHKLCSKGSSSHKHSGKGSIDCRCCSPVSTWVVVLGDQRR